MEQFIAGLFCMIVGLVISLLIIGISPSITFENAGFWPWLSTIIGVVLGLLIWSGGECLDFDLFD